MKRLLLAAALALATSTASHADSSSIPPFPPTGGTRLSGYAPGTTFNDYKIAAKDFLPLPGIQETKEKIFAAAIESLAGRDHLYGAYQFCGTADQQQSDSGIAETIGTASALATILWPTGSGVSAYGLKEFTASTPLLFAAYEQGLATTPKSFCG